MRSKITKKQTHDISIERLKIMSRNIGQLESRFEKLDVYIDFRLDKSIRERRRPNVDGNSVRPRPSESQSSAALL